jgi:hypothetical protein
MSQPAFRDKPRPGRPSHLDPAFRLQIDALLAQEPTMKGAELLRRPRAVPIWKTKRRAGSGLVACWPVSWLREIGRSQGKRTAPFLAGAVRARGPTGAEPLLAGNKLRTQNSTPSTRARVDRRARWLACASGSPSPAEPAGRPSTRRSVASSGPSPSRSAS